MSKSLRSTTPNVVFLTTLAFFYAVTTSVSAMQGDVDGNGVVDIQDARMIGRYVTGQISSIPSLADADATQDGIVNMEDAFAIAKHVAGKSRVLETFVRHAQSSAFHTGDPVCIRFSEHFFPFNVTGACVRVRSSSKGYDSGLQPLTFEQDGRSLYFNWPTTLRQPAADYVVDLTIQEKSLASPQSAKLALSAAAPDKTSLASPTDLSATVSLSAEVPDKYILASQTDLFLPFWDIGLHVTRSFPYTSAYVGYKGAFGYGWIHSFGPTLTEFTDGSILIYDTMGRSRGRGKNDTYFSTPGDGRYYRKNTAGTYDSAPGDYSNLTRDPDGTFQLRSATGEIWKFGTDLRPVWFKSITGRKVSLSYDEQGRLSLLADDSSQQIILTYNASGLVTGASDSTGREVVYGYDPGGHLVSVTDPVGNTTVYDYDDQHRLSKVSFPDGRHRYFSYNAENRQLKRLSSDGGWFMDFSFTNTVAGLQEIDTDALGRTSRTLCNARGLLLESENNLGQKTINHYDDAGHLVGVTDPANNLWGMIPDVTGNPAQTTDPESRTVSATYSPINNSLSSLVDGNGQQMAYQYYENGELACITYPDGSTEMTAYTNTFTGRTVARKLRNDAIITNYFDPRGLMLRKILPGGAESRFAYDTRGNLTNTINATVALSFEYDILSRVTKVTYPGARMIRYEYDSMSRRTRMIDPDGRALAYAYDAAGRLSTITDAATGPVVTYTYNAAGQVTERLLANGVKTTYGYDPAGRLSSISSRDSVGALVASYAYTFDALGNVLAKASLAGTETYAYDKTAQITNITYASGAKENIQYDAAANIESVIRSGQSPEIYFANNLNQYQSAGAESFTYDGNGNLASRTSAGSTVSYIHDTENQLTQVQLPNGSTVTYSYDPFGRLASRTDAAGTVYYLWDANGILIEENADHVTQACHTWGQQVNEIASTRRGATTHFYLHDRLLSVSEVLSQAGLVLQRCAYTAHGELSSGSLAGETFGFCGSFFDNSTGLYNMRARWYLPRFGRFIEPDPIGVVGGLNIYAYADNNPASLVDYYGFCAGAGGGGGGGGGGWLAQLGNAFRQAGLNFLGGFIGGFISGWASGGPGPGAKFGMGFTQGVIGGVGSALGGMVTR